MIHAFKRAKATNYLVAFSCIFLVLTTQAQTRQSFEAKSLNYTSFKSPPRDSHIYTWWHFIDGYITREGITKDLEAMKQQGIRGATILNVNEFNGTLGNPVVKFGSAQWYDMFKYALQEAKRLDIEIGIQNCDGWSTSGGPWITPENSMKQYIWRKSFITGGRQVSLKLDKPIGNNGFYKDAYVMAYKAGEPNTFKTASPTITLDGKNVAATLADGCPSSNLNLKVGNPIVIQFEKSFTAEALLVNTQRTFSKNGTRQTTIFNIATSDDGINYNQIAQVTDTIVNESLLLPFPRATAKYFKVIIKEVLKNDKPDEMRISELALLKSGEKWLYQPSIYAHQAKIGLVSVDRIEDFYAPYTTNDHHPDIDNKANVINLTANMQPDGTFNWKAPAGNWTILRFGYTTTGKKNHPATKEGEGLECDKMDTAALNVHFKNFPQKLIEAAGNLKGNTFNYLFVDSWEALYQNWTDNIVQEFQKRRGYSMLPYLPVLCGETVESITNSEAFLHDYRHTIADLIENYYFKHLADLCHRQGLLLHAEPIYGGVRAPPLDVLKTNSYFDIPMTEFWSPIKVADTPFTYDTKNRISATLPIHGALLYNQPVVASESYTGFALYSDSPWDLKLYGDNALTEGVNRFVLHSYVHQPDEKKPGLTLGMYGLSFNRHNTWWPYASSYFDEQARAQYILQKGQIVADVLVYIGDKLPYKEQDDKTSMLLKGVRFNYCNADVLYNRISVKGGKLLLDNKTAFQVLIVNDAEMDLATLQKIESLVNEGAIIICPKPTRTLTLKNHAADSAAMYTIAAKLWANINGTSQTKSKYGKGAIIWGKAIGDVLKQNNFVPDLQVTGAKMEDLMYIHKKVSSQDVYYIVNKSSNKAVQLEAAFRVTGMAPECWNPVDGSVVKPALYIQNANTTVLPIFLRARQSIFVVFNQKPVQAHFERLNTSSGITLFPATGHTESVLPAVSLDSDGLINITSEEGGNYTLSLNNKKTFSCHIPTAKKIVLNEAQGTITLSNEPQVAPFAFKQFKSLTNNENPLVKYYSGTSVYQTTVNLPANFVLKSKIVYLQIDEFGSTAEVMVNGKPVAIIWEPGYKLNISAFVKAGTNKLLIKVTNPWRNRLIGDMISPRGKSNAYTSSPFRENGALNVINAGTKLLNSGISKPIKVYSVETVKIKF
jgi:hypothetical protein